jgi:hypothetical protein
VKQQLERAICARLETLRHLSSEPSSSGAQPLAGSSPPPLDSLGLFRELATPVAARSDRLVQREPHEHADSMRKLRDLQSELRSMVQPKGACSRHRHILPEAASTTAASSSGSVRSG